MEMQLEFKLMQNIRAGTNRKEKWKQVVIFHSVGYIFLLMGLALENKTYQMLNQRIFL